MQQTFVDAGNTRSYINHICGVIRRVFKWGASQELVPVTVYHALATVPGLKKGRTPARWTPNQLRHKAGTEIRRQYGLEAAQVTLGHARADVTQVYAERDYELARKVMRKIG